jgi:hypothetical protein
MYAGFPFSCPNSQAKKNKRKKVDEHFKEKKWTNTKVDERKLSVCVCLCVERKRERGRERERERERESKRWHFSHNSLVNPTERILREHTQREQEVAFLAQLACQLNTHKTGWAAWYMRESVCVCVCDTHTHTHTGVCA